MRSPRSSGGVWDDDDASTVLSRREERLAAQGEVLCSNPVCKEKWEDWKKNHNSLGSKQSKAAAESVAGDEGGAAGGGQAGAKSMAQANGFSAGRSLAPGSVAGGCVR